MAVDTARFGAYASLVPTGREHSDSFEAVFDCPSCDGQHRATGVVEFRRQPIVFGGGGADARTSEMPWSGRVICPRTEAAVECHLMIAAADGDYIRRLTVERVLDGQTESVPNSRARPTGGAPTAPPPAAQDDWITAEIADWRRNSIATMRTFSTTMLTSSSAAVAVYFSVLKYLGFDTVRGTWGWVSVLPPLLFLSAAAMHAFALHPALRYVTADDYAEFRARRINQIYRRASLGTLLFVAALLLSIVVFLSNSRW